MSATVRLHMGLYVQNIVFHCSLLSGNLWTILTEPLLDYLNNTIGTSSSSTKTVRTYSVGLSTIRKLLVLMAQVGYISGAT